MENSIRIVWLRWCVYISHNEKILQQIYFDYLINKVKLGLDSEKGKRLR